MLGHKVGITNSESGLIRFNYNNKVQSKSSVLVEYSKSTIF